MRPSEEGREAVKVVQLAIPPSLPGPPGSTARSISTEETFDDGASLAAIDEEARLEGTTGKSCKPQLILVGNSTTAERGRVKVIRDDQTVNGLPHHPGLKRAKRNGTAREMAPPTPWGCEWRRDDKGWNLWRCWSERDESSGRRVARSRYAGYLSHEAWEVMKGYDYETFLSIIGQRFRRHGKR